MSAHSKQDNPAIDAGLSTQSALTGSSKKSIVRMTLVSRIVIVVIALSLALTYYFPLWEITLEAPQYPEGLGFEIWINQMAGQHPGDLKKINNLNHYIGMKSIQPESIRELTIMPWIMRGLMLFGLVVAAIGRRFWLLLWLLLFIAVASAGFVDFYLWGYDYGHNLDTEKAIIKVPGMSYQPPLIGSKKLLNFRAISLPGIGGWAAIGAFLVGALVWLKERYRTRKHLLKSAAGVVGLLSALLLSLSVGCGSRGPTPIHYGTDQCDYCSMTIADNRFGSELVTAKGKTFKYDSIECLAAAEYSKKGISGEIHSRWVTDFDTPGAFLSTASAIIVATDRQKSPMGVGLVAVGNKARADELIISKGGRVVDWSGAKLLVVETWKLESRRDR